MSNSQKMDHNAIMDPMAVSESTALTSLMKQLKHDKLPRARLRGVDAFREVVHDLTKQRNDILDINHKNSSF
ncbi:MAG: hypothetical protein HQL53_04605 [Magnetococcales bacterium]|nr:hypothetical protein [Magnetococcales bacterium]